MFLINSIKFIIFVSPIFILGSILSMLDSGKTLDIELCIWATIFMVIGFAAIWSSRRKFIAQSIFLLSEVNLSIGGIIILAGFFPQI